MCVDGSDRAKVPPTLTGGSIDSHVIVPLGALAATLMVEVEV